MESGFATCEYSKQPSIRSPLVWLLEPPKHKIGVEPNQIVLSPDGTQRLRLMTGINLYPYEATNFVGLDLAPSDR
ncbi:hypothetical protein TNCV_3631401 [Trichonephila clavipes]|nr:hypothetical protein TNCV_3631401 [Trichonephila clavipes]